MNNLVSIIIPTYNREKEITECLDSLRKITYSNFEIIVVDNASQDDTVSQIKINFPEVKLVCLKENKGAVGGRNEGIKHGRGDYFCFIDSDNYFNENFLNELVKLAESDRKIGFVGPKMYYYKDPKRIWFAGVDINFLTSRTTYIGINEIDKGQYDQIREIIQIPNVWLVKKEIIDKIGVMDEIYVMSYGESDWPIRANRAGYKIMFCPSSIVYHNIEVPNNISEGIMARGTKYRTYYFARNRIIFMKKFASKINFIIFMIIFNNLFLVIYLWSFLINQRLDLVKSYLKGYSEGVMFAIKGE